jgi:quercetin dioxygenase-like cupin family protein
MLPWRSRVAPKGIGNMSSNVTPFPPAKSQWANPPRANSPAEPSELPPEVLDVLGPRIQYITPLSEADEGYCLIKSTIPPGVVVPVHSHADRETFYILAGELQGFAEDRWHRFGPGGVFEVLGEIRHAFRNISGESASGLIITTMKMGRFLREIGRPAATVASGPPAAADLQRFVQRAHDYGYWLGGPEDNAAIDLLLG